MVNEMGKGWKDKLPKALWAYRTAYKTPINMSPYQLVYVKSCHSPEELKHGTITESSKKSSRKETKFFYSTPKSSSLVKANFGVSGKDCTPSSTHHHMARSQFRMMKVILLR